MNLNDMNPFKVLEMPIVDDGEKVKEAYAKVMKKYERFQSSSDPQQRAHYKNICSAFAMIETIEKRQAVIRKYIEDMRNDIEIFISGREKIERADFESLVAGEIKRHGFDPGLARSEIEKCFREKNITIGKKIERKPAMVENFSIDLKGNEIKLAWRLPAEKLDAVHVIRKENSSPKRLTDGQIVYQGAGSACVDGAAEKGNIYYYAVYSRLGNDYSEPVIRRGLIPAPVTGVKYRSGCNYIQLNWDAPENSESVCIIRNKNTPPSFSQNGSSIRVTQGKEVFSGREKSFKDVNLTAETSYWYCFIAIFPGNLFSDAVEYHVQTQTFPKSPCSLSIAETDQGVLLNWPNDPAVDGFHLIKKENSPPAGPQDGSVLLHGKGISWSDEKGAAGVICYYALYTYTEAHFSSPARVEHVFKQPPSNVTVSAGDSWVEIKWATPPGARQVVIRKSATAPPDAPGSGDAMTPTATDYLRDNEVINGKAYCYSLFSEYVINGKTEYSKSAKLQSIIPLSPVTLNDVEMEKVNTPKGYFVKCSWTYPENEKTVPNVCIVTSKEPLGKLLGLDSINGVSFAKLYNYLNNHNFRGRSGPIQIKWAETRYETSVKYPDTPLGCFTIFAARLMAKSPGDNFPLTLCKEQRFIHLPDVEELKLTTLSDGRRKLTWKWPDNYRAVYVVTIPRGDGHTPHIVFNDGKLIAQDNNNITIPDGRVILFTEAQYIRERALIINNKDDSDYTIFTGFKGEGGYHFSVGKKPQT